MRQGWTNLSGHGRVIPKRKLDPKARLSFCSKLGHPQLRSQGYANPLQVHCDSHPNDSYPPPICTTQRTRTYLTNGKSQKRQFSPLHKACWDLQLNDASLLNNYSYQLKLTNFVTSWQPCLIRAL